MNRPAWLTIVPLVAALAACGEPVPPSPLRQQCATPEDCPAREACEGGACVALAAGACRKPSDCDAGEACVADACATVCVIHADCPARTECAGGLCATLAAGACHKASDCGAEEVCTGGRCSAECGLPENQARRLDLERAQPALAADPSSGKPLRTTTSTFASVAGNPAVRCEVALRYKDLSGDGALQPYEDWTLTPAERADDLAARLGPSGWRALLAHPVLPDVPTASAPGVTEATRALLDAGVRAGQTAATGSTPLSRATWSNLLQARCEAAPFGVPFLLSSAPAHADGEGRVRSAGFTAWPPELAIAAGGDQGRAEAFGRYTAQELRAIGVRMVVSHAANLATDPRWPRAPSTFGEHLATASGFAKAYVQGAQGEQLGRESVAVVLGDWPGAGAARDGLDARLAKGRFTSYDGGRFDAHAAAFDGAFAAGVAGIMPGHAIPAYGTWSGFGDPLLGQKVQQVGVPFNVQLLGGPLRRGLLDRGPLVLAPAGAIEDAALAPFGAPWGVEALTRPQRIAQAVGAGVDQFLGLGSVRALEDAALSDAAAGAAARRVLRLMFALGLFEDPYVDPAAVPRLVGAYPADFEALRATYGGMVLLRNVQKPAGWLNGSGDGTQTGDWHNAGNGTLRVLPAPPGIDYVGSSRPTWFYVGGGFDLDWVDSVSSGYGLLVNRLATFAAMTEAEKMAASDYVIVRIRAPWPVDPDSGPLGLPLPPLSWAAADPAALAPVAAARAALDAHPTSKAQLVVIVDAARPPVVAEVLAYAPSALYVSWAGPRPENPQGDKVALDLIFGIVDGAGKLPVSLPASDEAAAAQLPDVPGDGADATSVRGYGLETRHF